MSLKGKIHKTAILRAVVISALVVLAAQKLSAQEPEQYNFIVDEVLDQIEENYEPTESVEIPTEAAVPDSLELDPDTEIPKEIKVLEEIIITEDADPQDIDETSEPSQIPEIPTTQETKIIPLLYAEASSIIETLDQMKSPTGEVTYNEEDRTLIIKDEPQQLEAMSTFVKAADIQLETEIFQLEHIKAKDIIEKVKAVLTKDVGQVQYDEETNSIIATDTLLIIENVKTLIEQLDRVNKAVQIETKILQIVLNDEHEAGVDWEAIVSDYQNVTFSGFKLKEGPQESARLNLGAVTQEDYTILLEALDTVGVVDTISDDTLTLANGGTGSVSVLPSFLREMQKSDPDMISESERVRFQLTPAIDQDGSVSVEIQPELVGGNTRVLTEPTKLKAAFEVKDGTTVVVGSLFDEVMVESTWKVPLLGDLPFLGFVFRNQGEVSRKSEIITFLTVKVIEKKINE